MRRLFSLAVSSSLLVFAACSPNNTGGTDAGDEGIVIGSADGGGVIPCDGGGTITFSINAPSCLWPPNHDMVLFTTADVTITANGCTAPTVTIVSVTENTGSGCHGHSCNGHNGNGNGKTSDPDYTFNSTGVCLRAEKDPNTTTPRTYTVTFEATDGTNTIQDSVDVVVEHDQGNQQCPNIDPKRIVADGDPRCN